MRVVHVLPLLILLIRNTSSLHSTPHRQPVSSRDTSVSSLRYERVTPSRHVRNNPILNSTKPITYATYDLISYRFIGAGASGEVFLMQNLDTGEFSIMKRYFKEGRFEDQNYIMDQMGYPISWARDELHNNTVSIFPCTDSRNIGEVLLDNRDVKIVLFKILLELNKTVSKGFFHMDIKPLNIIVDAVFEDGDYVTKRSKVQIIDWNLVNFYYEGAEYNFRRGTSCYQAPELMIWAKHYTPVVDVWSLGISLYYLIVGKKPLKGCTKDQLGSLIRFVGYKQFKEFYDRIGVQSNQEILRIIKENVGHPGEKSVILDTNPSLDSQTIRILNRMLTIDPVSRPSFHQLLQDRYFQDVTQLSPPYLEKEKKKKAKHQELMNLAQNIL